MIDLNASITLGDLEHLRHAVAAGERRAGYRNHFAPGGLDVASMHRLEAAGLVVRGRRYQETYFFHATAAGCHVAGLSAAATTRALCVGVPDGNIPSNI
jgi:hypothetical protein